MASLFSKPKMQAPPPPPPPVDDGAAQQKRVDAEREAITEQKARGRASTIHAGAEIAEEMQQGRGLLKSQARQARRLVTG